MNINLFNKTRYHKFIIINILLFLITNVSNLMSNSTLKIVLSSNNNKNYKFRNKYINKGNCFLIDKNLTNLSK